MIKTENVFFFKPSSQEQALKLLRSIGQSWILILIWFQFHSSSVDTLHWLKMHRPLRRSSSGRNLLKIGSLRDNPTIRSVNEHLRLYELNLQQIGPVENRANREKQSDMKILVILRKLLESVPVLQVSFYYILLRSLRNFNLNESRNAAPTPSRFLWNILLILVVQIHSLIRAKELWRACILMNL